MRALVRGVRAALPLLPPGLIVAAVVVGAAGLAACVAFL
mgnify:CR=1 FL=1